MEIVIVGSGIAGITLAEELRKLAPSFRVRVLTHETHGYYARPMLSHGFSKADVEQKIVVRTPQALRAEGIELIDGVWVTRIERERQRVVARRGTDEALLPYDRLVLALGSDAFIPPPLQKFAVPLHVVNSFDDLIILRRLRSEIQARGETPRWAIIGGGLIGCEVTSDLALAGDRVTLFHALDRLMERQLTAADSERLLTHFRDRSVEVVLTAAVDHIGKHGSRIEIHTGGQSYGDYHAVIATCGFKPRTDLAAAAGLACERGIRVDAFLATTDPAIHAIGDVAELPNGLIYAYIPPIRSQAFWLAQFLSLGNGEPWTPPKFVPRAKIHGFTPLTPLHFP